MGRNIYSFFKEKLFVMLMCLALILPLAHVGSQETDEVSSDDARQEINLPDNAETDSTGTVASEEAPGTAAPKDAPKSAAPKTATPKAAPEIQGVRTLTALINKVIGYISQIGAIFGQTTGIRIGGTSTSAIVMLVIARLIDGRAPDWVRRLLYISGGTMVAGSGANIMELIMQFL